MIEKILKEINRLKNELDGYSASEALDYIEAYINTISKESASEDLEEAAELYYEEDCPYEGEARVVNNEHDVWFPSQAIEDAFVAGAEWQKQKDYKMYAHVSLKDIHDAWQELKSNKPDIENSPAICFCRGANWRENQMKEALQTEYEKGRFDMKGEMMKDAVDATIFSELKGSDGSLFQAKSDRFRMNGVKLGKIIKIIPIKEEQQ